AAPPADLTVVARLEEGAAARAIDHPASILGLPPGLPRSRTPPPPPRAVGPPPGVGPATGDGTIWTRRRRAMTTTAAATRDEGVDPFLAPHWGTSALLVIDTQVDFAEGGSTPVAGTTAAGRGLAALVERYGRAGRPGVGVVRLYDGGGVDGVRRAAVAAGAPVVRPGTPGSAILPELVPPGAPPLDPPTLLAGRAQELGPD